MKRVRSDDSSVAARACKLEEFVLQQAVANKSFAVWIKAQPGGVSLASGVQDYRDYVAALKRRYLGDSGQVLTFGSGDCGQLAHGIDEDRDLMVKFPRKVLSLADKHVIGISCGGLHNAVFTSSGAVYTWGCNDDGSLGRDGVEHEALRVTTGGLENEVVVGVACGDGQTMCVTVKGVVYGWGCFKDKEGKKFFNPSPDDPKAKVKKQQDTPIVISGLPKDSKVLELACGSAHNLALCANGSVYSWGLGESGELGRPVGELKFPPDDEGEQEYDLKTISEQHIAPRSMLLEGGQKGGGGGDVRGCVAIGTGAFHSIVAVVVNTDDPKAATGCSSLAYSTGLNNYGQLGLGDTNNRSLLCEISALRNVGLRAVRGGMHHSLALAASGQVLAFGRGDSGQIGIESLSEKGGGEAGAYVSTPVLVPMPKNAGHVTGVSAGSNHNLAVTAQGAVYSWGYGDMLALGHGAGAKSSSDEDAAVGCLDEPAPKLIDLAKVKDAKLLGPGAELAVALVCGGGQHSALVASEIR